jgi:hypothetical protein
MSMAEPVPSAQHAAGLAVMSEPGHRSEVDEARTLVTTEPLTNGTVDEQSSRMAFSPVMMP